LGFRGVRPRPNGTFYAELRAGAFRLTLGTYESPEEAARAYDAAAWRVGRPRREKNFPETESLAEAEFLAPQPALVTEEDRRHHRAVQRRLAIAERDERSMAEGRRLFPQDVQAEVEFYAAKWAERRAARVDCRRRKTFIMAQIDGPQTIPDDGPRWTTCRRTSTRPPLTTRSSAARSLGSAQFNLCCLLLSVHRKPFLCIF
jgi:hypothetical protein